MDSPPPPTAAPSPSPAPASAGLSAAAVVAPARERPRAISWAAGWLPLLGVLALSAVLNLKALAQNGYANIFYSAGVRSMLRSLHNFFFVSFDPGGLVTVDKPPLALWVQAASARLFGFHPLSLLLPEAIMGVLAVGLLYLILARRFGVVAGVAGGVAMAIFPSYVAVSRSNGVDPLLILLMVGACGAGIRAAEGGRWRWLLACAALVGLAFNTKTLAAYLVVPGIALAFLVCAPGALVRRVLQLLAAGVAMALVSLAWMAAVELIPAAKRPYVGSSTNNTELGLTFQYNGFGRVGGQSGGPGHVPVRPGALLQFTPAQLADIRRHQAAHRGSSAEFTGASGSASSNRRARAPIPFGGPPGPLRLWGKGLGDQAGWLIPFALCGVLALALLSFVRWREPGSRRRRDGRLATLIVLGGWFLLEAVVLSVSKGIVHPYYTSALAPGTGAMAGAGAVAFAALARGRLRWLALGLLGAGLAATVYAQAHLLHQQRYMLWFLPVLLIAGGAAYCAVLVARRLALPGVAALLCVLAIAPAAYAATTWLAPVEATFPAAGPHAAAGVGGVGIAGAHLRMYESLIRYVDSTGTGSRWSILTVSAPTASPLILLGSDAGALAGYSGVDPAVDGPRLAGMVARGEARYVLLGGEFSSRGGNRATAAALRACRPVNPKLWHGPALSPYGLALLDCAGHERQLAAG
jgi:4-amino-4-deoxy-L-arabinose transferase-like glycosyltransferase